MRYWVAATCYIKKTTPKVPCFFKPKLIKPFCSNASLCSNAYQENKRGYWYEMDYVVGLLLTRFRSLLPFFPFPNYSYFSVVLLLQTAEVASRRWCAENKKKKWLAKVPWRCSIAQKKKFSIKDFFSECDQMSHSLKKFLMENFIF